MHFNVVTLTQSLLSMAYLMIAKQKDELRAVVLYAVYGIWYRGTPRSANYWSEGRQIPEIPQSGSVIAQHPTTINSPISQKTPNENSNSIQKNHGSALHLLPRQ